MLILKLLFSLLEIAAVVVATVVAFIYARQGAQLLRFRLCMRSFAKNDAEDRHPAIDVSGKKGTLEEERERLDTVFNLFYKPGLSILKLRAAERLREQAAFIRADWILWEEWRGWHKLATKGSSGVRARARATACRIAESRLHELSLGDLPKWLELYDEKDHPNRMLSWAQTNLGRPATKSAALRVLEKLAQSKEPIGASALYELFNHFYRKGSRTQTLAYAKRYLDQPTRTLDNVIRQSLRELFTPDLDVPEEYGAHWAVFGNRHAEIIVRVQALEINAADEVWLDEPTRPLAHAKVGEVLWESPIPPRWYTIFGRSGRFFKFPELEGPLLVRASAQLSRPPGWSDCMGEEAMPIRTRDQRVPNTSMDAVLTLTENSLDTWVVDKKEKKPLGNIDLRLMRRESNGTLETQSATTDEKGRFSWTGKRTWQFGVLATRTNSQGRREQVFLTNSDDVTTSKPPNPSIRLYMMLSRPLYRPGERVQGKLIARSKGHEGPSAKLGTKMTYAVEVISPRGVKITTLNCTLSEFATASFDFVIPKDAPLGKYSFRATKSEATLEGSFYVEEFVAPEFRADLRSKDKLTWGTKSKLEFDATYFFGGPVAQAHGTLEIKRSNWRYRYVSHGSFSKWFRSPKQLAPISFKTDAQGHASIEVRWKGPLDLLRRLDGCDFDFVATVRDASGKSCQARLQVSIPRREVLVSAKPIRPLRIPGEPLRLGLAWEPADPTDVQPREVTITCRNGSSTKTFVHSMQRAEVDFQMPLELSAGTWDVSAHVDGQPKRLRTKHACTLLGPEIEKKTREFVVSNDPDDNQGTIRVALMGPKSHCGHDLLVWNRGHRLGSVVLERSGPTVWFDLPYLAGREEEVYLSWWYLDRHDEPLQVERAKAVIHALTIEREAPIDFSLAFPKETLRPGTDTTLEANLSARQERPSEMTVTVVDEAIFSLVAVPKSPRAFFEDSPPRPESFAAWSVTAANVHRGRQTYSPRDTYDLLPQAPAQEMAYLGGIPAQSMAMPMPMMARAAAPMMDMPLPAPAAKSGGPLRAAAAIAAAPVALAAAGAGMLVERGRMKNRLASAEIEQQDGAASMNAAPVQLRSDFSSEAAWIPNARFARGSSLTLPIKLPDTLTTWKASAILISMGHEHLLEAHARVRTQKPLMVRLQTPRFFQERDVLALRAMVDSRSDKQLAVQTILEARGFVLPDNAQSSHTLEPNGQARVDVTLKVPTCQTKDVVVRAQAVATDADDASDAEERTVPYLPYGVLLRKTMSGVLGDEPTSVSFELPAQRIKEFTALSIQIDRGPMDAILKALLYLREYPYGCVEQTCSRVLPHLVYEQLVDGAANVSDVYRQTPNRMPENVVEETLQRIAGMQNSDGGFGWWAGCKSDVWMTAYVIFTFVAAEQPESSMLQDARVYLAKQILERDHSDDADAFAAFALTWAGATVTDRVLEVLSSRWDGLALREKAKFCWVLAERGQKHAGSCVEEVRDALVVPAKRFLKKVAKDEDDADLQWFHPGSTEAIAFFVLGLLHKDNQKRNFVDDRSLEVLISFLLQHRKGARWHNTRDTAIAVLALLRYEGLLRGTSADRKVDVLVNAEKKRTATLERLGAKPVSVQFEDEDLRSGTNELSFVLDKPDAGAPVVHRHFSAELEYYSQESEIAATSEGLTIERTYWVLNEKKEPKRQLRNGDKIEVGQRLRVVLKLEAKKLQTYLLLEDRKLAGCEPVAKKSGREVCTGYCAHVELRADRTAIFFDVLGTEPHEVSYDIEAILPGRFSAMPARIETMYEARCVGTSASFALEVGEG